MLFAFLGLMLGHTISDGGNLCTYFWRVFRVAAIRVTSGVQVISLSFCFRTDTWRVFCVDTPEGTLHTSGRAKHTAARTLPVVPQVESVGFRHLERDRHCVAPRDGEKRWISPPLIQGDPCRCLDRHADVRHRL